MENRYGIICFSLLIGGIIVYSFYKFIKWLLWISW
jgi:hypothetical protein